jgi:hypothetical protein
MVLGVLGEEWGPKVLRVSMYLQQSAWGQWQQWECELSATHPLLLSALALPDESNRWTEDQMFAANNQLLSCNWQQPSWRRVQRCRWGTRWSARLQARWSDVHDRGYDHKFGQFFFNLNDFLMHEWCWYRCHHVTRNFVWKKTIRCVLCRVFCVFRLGTDPFLVTF